MCHDETLQWIEQHRVKDQYNTTRGNYYAKIIKLHHLPFHLLTTLLHLPQRPIKQQVRDLGVAIKNTHINIGLEVLTIILIPENLFC